MFDSERVEWTQISVTGAIPPICSHSATLLSSENSIILACGLSPESNEEGDGSTLNPTNSIYRLSWSLENETGGARVKSEDEEEEVQPAEKTTFFPDIQFENTSAGLD